MKNIAGVFLYGDQQAFAWFFPTYVKSEGKLLLACQNNYKEMKSILIVDVSLAIGENHFFHSDKYAKKNKFLRSA